MGYSGAQYQQMEEEEEGDEGEDEPGKLPWKPGLRPCGVEVVQKYDRDNVIENRIMYG